MMNNKVIAEIIRKEFKGFWKKGHDEQLEIIKRVNEKFNEIFNKNIKIMFKNDKILYYITGGGVYNAITNTIILYKLSLMTFLHEWGHVISGYDEKKAVVFSHSVFRIAFPKLYIKSLQKGLFLHDPFNLRQFLTAEEKQ